MKECNYKHGEMKKDRKTMLGIFFLVIGIILLGQNLHFLPYPISHFLFTWPMLLIAIGIIQIAVKGKSVGGLFLMGVGGIFLWDKIAPLSSFQWQIAWPIMFILIGAALVIFYLGSSIKQIIESKPSEPSKPKSKKTKTKHADVEFDIDKIEPIDD